MTSAIEFQSGVDKLVANLDIADKLVNTDSDVATGAGVRPSFPKVLREFVGLGTARDDAVAAAQQANASAEQVGQVIHTGLPAETGAMHRVRIGRRLLAYFDRAGLHNVIGLALGRLGEIRQLERPLEAVPGWRWVRGKRTFMSLDQFDGLAPFHFTLPRSAVFDGDDTTLLERVMATQSVSLGLPIASFGDSLTEGYPDGVAWSVMLAARLGVDVTNNGIMGQRSIDIVARQGGAPSRITVTGNVATTAGVIVTARSANPMYYGGPTAMDGVVNGNRCVLSTDGVVDDYGVRDGQLTLTAVDGPFPVPPGSAFYPNQALIARNRTQFVGFGRNDIDWSGYKVPTLNPNGTNYIADPVATTLASHAAAEAYVVPFGGRMLHGAVLLSLDEYDGGARNPAPARAINAQLATLYGTRFVDLSSPATAMEMAAIGYVPTSADATDAARGVFQRGLRSDSIHPNKQGYRIHEFRIARALIAQGWYA